MSICSSLIPLSLSSKVRLTIFSSASTKGCTVVICEPICISIPVNFTFESFDAVLNISKASVSSIPNLFSASPVEMYG